MLAVYRQQRHLPGLGRLQHQPPAGHQRLLIGQQNPLAYLGGSEHRPQSRHAHHGAQGVLGARRLQGALRTVRPEKPFYALQVRGNAGRRNHQPGGLGAKAPGRLK